MVAKPSTSTAPTVHSVTAAAATQMKIAARCHICPLGRPLFARVGFVKTPALFFLRPAGSKQAVILRRRSTSFGLGHIVQAVFHVGNLKLIFVVDDGILIEFDDLRVRPFLFLDRSHCLARACVTGVCFAGACLPGAR